MRLAIISHTEHYKTPNGDIVGWGPTVTEINHLTELFDEITHVAMLKEGAPPPSALPYTSDKIKFIPIPTSGGRNLGDKLEILWKAPQVITIVSHVLKKVDIYQLRLPTGIGIYLIPYLTLFSQTKGWYKYAGNWNQQKAPLGYAIQRWMLKNQSRKVTINGFWDNQPTHCLSFENPCLTEMDIERGKKIREKKRLIHDIHICFVGRLEKEKGVGTLIQSILTLPEAFQRRIAHVHLVGDGPDRQLFELMAAKSSVPITFHGFMAREAVHDIYKQSHVFILPTTASEGFPKVIAEAMNYGCVPIVSDLSAISHYVHHAGQGFLLKPVTVSNLSEMIIACLNMDDDNYQKILVEQESILKSFTFNHYHEHIRTGILS